MNKQVGKNSHVTCDFIYFFAVSRRFMTKVHGYLHDDEHLKNITKKQKEI